MKIALVQCPAFNIRMPQIGPAYLKSALEAGGHQVLQFDLNIKLYNQKSVEEKKYWNYEFCSAWDSPQNGLLSEGDLERWASDILNSGAGLLGFTVYSTSLKTSLLLAEQIKRMDRERKIALGGPGIAHLLDMDAAAIEDQESSARSLLNAADILVLGEGEEAVLDIVERLQQNASMAGCLGVIAKEKGDIVFSGPRPLKVNLDELPFPDFSVIEQHAFGDKGYFPILASRGCPNRCSFCDYPYLGRYRFRKRSVENVLLEMKLQASRYGAQFFHFNDSTINADTRFLFALCDGIIKERMNIRWGGSASISPGLTRELFSKMKESGCEYLSFGIESASGKVLRDMKKNFSAGDIESNIVDCYESGIGVMTNWIIGFPTETEEDFQETLKFIEKNKSYIDGLDVALLCVKKHTHIYDNMESYGIKLNDVYDWSVTEAGNTYAERLKRLKSFWKGQIGRVHFDRVGGYFNMESMASLLEELRLDYKAAEEKRKSDFTMKKGNLEFFFDQGKGRIFCDGRELTKGLGLYTSCLLPRGWIDSRKAQWEAVLSGNDKLIIKGAYGVIPLLEEIRLEFKDQATVNFRIELRSREALEIQNHSVNLMVSEGYACWQMGERRGGFSGNFTNEWNGVSGVGIGSEAFLEEGYIEGGCRLPDISLVSQASFPSSEVAEVVNTPLNFKARMISQRKELPGRMMPETAYIIEGEVKINDR